MIEVSGAATFKSYRYVLRYSGGYSTLYMCMKDGTLMLYESKEMTFDGALCAARAFLDSHKYFKTFRISDDKLTRNQQKLVGKLMALV